MDRRKFLAGASFASSGFLAKQQAASPGEQPLAADVIVELMGYKRLCGRLTKGAIPGLLQLDVWVGDGKTVTQFINPSSVYRITVVTTDMVAEFLSDAKDVMPELQITTSTSVTRKFFDEDEYDEDDDPPF